MRDGGHECGGEAHGHQKAEDGERRQRFDDG